MSDTLNRYESTFIINAAIEETTIEETVTKFNELLKEQNAEILKLDKVGRKRLAYPIQKKHSGFYVTVEFKSDAKVVPVFERALQLDDYILRYLTIQVDKKILSSREQEKRRASVEAEPTV